MRWSVRDNDRFAAIANVFAEIRRTYSIFHIVRTPWRVREVESYALSKFQPPTTLGDLQTVEKTIQKKIDVFGSRKLAFRQFWWILEEVRPNECQNQLQGQILLQIDLF